MYTYKYPHPAVTADCIVFARCPEAVYILLIKRSNYPFAGYWAFPGGFMNIDESAEDAARRELLEETGLRADKVWQVGAFADVDRDPRERIVTLTYCTAVDGKPSVKGADDAAEARWFRIEDVPRLAFDHNLMLEKAIEIASWRGIISL